MSEAVGYGVVANGFIPRGTVVWVRDDFDLLLAQAEIERLPPSHRAITERYAYRDATGTYLLCWDFARYVKHSCDPSLLGGTEEFEVALRDLHPGEELTDDYATLNLESSRPFDCDWSPFFKEQSIVEPEALRSS